MGLRILLLEDNAADADLIVTMLRRSNIEFEAVVVSRRQEYIEAISTQDFDIILSDHSLPQFSSVEAFDELRKIRTDISFILVTGTVSEEFAVEMIQKGVDDYVLKGNIRRLPSAILRAMDNRRIQRDKEHAERELQLAHDRLLFHVENAPLGFIEWDSHLQIKSWSKRASEIFRCTEFDFLQIQAAGEVPGIPWDPQVTQQLLSGAIERNRLQLQNTTGDRKKIWCEWFNSVLKDREGKVVTIMSLVQDITDQKNAEAELIASEKYNRNLFNQSTLGLALSSLSDGTLVDVNEAYAKILGRSIEECKTLTYFDITPEKYNGEEQEVLRQLRETGKFGPYDKESIHKDGHLVNVRLSGTILEKNGQDYIWASVEDVTQSKKTEVALKSSLLELEKAAARQSAIINSLSSQVALLDEEGTIIQVNAAWKRHATQGEDMPGVNYLKMVENGDIRMSDAGKTIANAIRQIISGKGNEFSIEYAHNLKTERRWFRTTVSPFDQSNQGGVVIAHTNISESRLTEDLKYRQIVETAQEGIWMFDENGMTNFVNEKLCEILGYGADEIIGKARHYFMDDEGRKIANETFEMVNNGTESIVDFKFITKDGSPVWANLSTNPVFSEGSIYKGTLALVTDISLRKQNAELLKKSENNLEKKNKELEIKNIELEQFAYVASHDLQEPLRTTSSFVSLFQKQYQGRLDEKADQYLTYIIQASERMKLLIKDLLDYSRIGKETEWVKVDCNDALQHVLADVGRAISEAEAKIHAQSLPVTYGYETELKQLFQNLVLNAIKFRNKNIQLELYISATLTNNHWQFAFSDNGIGIEQKHHERIFVIFQRLHNRAEFEGSGIGLSHCKKIVELHNGKIWVESAPGKGSTFYFTLPASQGAAAPKRAAFTSA